MNQSKQPKKPLARAEGIIPILNVKGISVSKEFYINLPGFTEAAWGNNDFTCIHRDNAAIYLCRNGQGQPGTWVWIGFDGNIFSLYEELNAKGANILQPPTNYSWALEMHIQDPDGHVLRLGTDPDENEPYIDRTL